jgi:hypothetical protein
LFLKTYFYSLLNLKDSFLLFIAEDSPSFISNAEYILTNSYSYALLFNTTSSKSITGKILPLSLFFVKIDYINGFF